MQGWPCDVIYKINCLDCETYVRQIKRKLKTRKNKRIYKADIRRSTDAMSIVLRHQFDNEHELDWKNISILDIE